MKRAIILVLDSFGIGATPDAAQFGDEGSDTFGHIAEQCANGSLGRGPIHLPNLAKIGLYHAHRESTGAFAAGVDQTIEATGSYGYAKELSSGKDTPSGHWEMAGVPVLFDWGYFHDKTNSFPQALIDAFVERAGVDAILGNCHSSGTVILDELGEAHIRTGQPIVYTSADSVFQIACHEQTFGLERLYELCEIARELLDDYNIGRVIARPFVGEKSGAFERTANRRDYSVLPPAPTLLDKLSHAGGEVVSVGKIADIFAHQGIGKKIKASGIDGLFDATLGALEQASERSLIFSNFVDFDSSFGHRRDVKGYADALEQFDQRLPELLAKLADDDLLILTADHGCDPTWAGTDHTREHVPVLVVGGAVPSGSLGQRETFADIGQTLAAYFDLAPMDYGSSFLK
ncbi:phosphopentomutase [Neiella marina]|uniref:Phosphopentomutase n=1 Tax=Neiella holothuriorum TaxID=2870530 RepID=A0ABS7EH53_9GAMM|nr:phosphopentomutase [Neiella holothuriorum]MBW8191111.1 phosphopentomutase [Neiella holothuriorum]